MKNWLQIDDETTVDNVKLISLIVSIFSISLSYCQHKNPLISMFFDSGKLIKSFENRQGTVLAWLTRS